MSDQQDRAEPEPINVSAAIYQLGIVIAPLLLLRSNGMIAALGPVAVDRLEQAIQAAKNAAGYLGVTIWKEQEGE